MPVCLRADWFWQNLHDDGKSGEYCPITYMSASSFPSGVCQGIINNILCSVCQCKNLSCAHGL